ncbi:MAG: hypothetical protein E7571_00815 [Ruminococcaceae bacterium]|nr:hypothetical protein [Oscillospiraceae bacterium]
MSYKKLLKMVAAEYNTTPKEVDSEIRAAIKAAGYDMEPELFIALAASKVSSAIEQQKKSNN